MCVWGWCCRCCCCYYGIGSVVGTVDSVCVASVVDGADVLGDVGCGVDGVGVVVVGVRMGLVLSLL